MFISQIIPEKLDTSTPSWIENLVYKKIKEETLTCGVCAEKIETEKWIDHIEGKHEYLAWAEGQPPLVSMIHYIICKLRATKLFLLILDGSFHESLKPIGFETLYSPREPIRGSQTG